jgi:hypothetical protein
VEAMRHKVIISIH